MVDLKNLKIRDKCMAVRQSFSRVSNVYHFVRVWPTALKLGCITNFDMLFLMMGFISLVDEIQSMLISNHHVCILGL